MKRQPYRNRYLTVLNTYHGLLVMYWILRGLFGGAFWWLALLNTFALIVMLPLTLTLLLALILRGKWTSVLALLLGIIAVVQFAPLPKSSVLTSDPNLRLLTFNIWADNPRSQETLDWIVSQDADVVIVQEALQNHEPYLHQLAEHYPYYLHMTNSLMLLSRYPFLENDFLRFESAAHHHPARMAIRIVIEVDGSPLTIYGVHLSSPLRRPSSASDATQHAIWETRYDETRRNEQINTLLEHIAEEANPVILAGDFNMSDTSVIYHTISAAGLVDTYREAGSGYGFSWPVFPLIPPVLRIDYIWHTPAIRTARISSSPRLGSDHFGLTADFALK